MEEGSQVRGMCRQVMARGAMRIEMASLGACEDDASAHQRGNLPMLPSLEGSAIVAQLHEQAADQLLQPAEQSVAGALKLVLPLLACCYHGDAQAQHMLKPLVIAVAHAPDATHAKTDPCPLLYRHSK